MPLNETILGLNLVFTITTIVMFYVMKKEQDRFWENIERYVKTYIHTFMKNEKK